MCLIEEPAAEERALLILNKSGEVVEVSLRRIGPQGLYKGQNPVPAAVLSRSARAGAGGHNERADQKEHDQYASQAIIV